VDSPLLADGARPGRPGRRPAHGGHSFCFRNPDATIRPCVGVKLKYSRGARRWHGVRLDAQVDEKALEDSLTDGLAELTPTGKGVSQEEFAEVVAGALEAVGGRLLFKMEIGTEGERQHLAAASVGEGERRQFLLLSLPVGGGKLKVESAASSENPVANITAAYAGLMDVLQAAA